MQIRTGTLSQRRWLPRTPHQEFEKDCWGPTRNAEEEPRNHPERTNVYPLLEAQENEWKGVPIVATSMDTSSRASHGEMDREIPVTMHQEVQCRQSRYIAAYGITGPCSPGCDCRGSSMESTSHT